MDPYLGEIRMFAGNFAPVDWHLCDGALLSVAEYNALFSVVGVTWGGDGTTNFGIPDLRGRVPIGQGPGAGLSPRIIGNKGGVETVALTTDQIPAHNHLVNVTTVAATETAPGPNVILASTTAPTANFLPPAAAGTLRIMNSNTVGVSGGSGAHDNVMPSFAVTFIICLSGIYPVQQ